MFATDWPTDTPAAFGAAVPDGLPRRCDPVRERPGPLQAAVIVDCDILQRAGLPRPRLHATSPRASGRPAPSARAGVLAPESRASPARRSATAPTSAPIPAGDAARGAHRRMAARRLRRRRRTSPFLREQLLDALRRRVRRPHPAARGRRELDLEFGAALRRAIKRLAGGRVARPRAAAARVDQRRLRGRRALRARDRPLRRRPALRAGAACSSAPPSRSGARKYWPLYRRRRARAAGRRPLRRLGGPPLTGTGLPRFYLEDQVGMATAFQDQLDEPRVRGRLRGDPGAADRAHRGRRRLARAAHVADGPRVRAAAGRRRRSWTAGPRRSSASTCG